MIAKLEKAQLPTQYGFEKTVIRVPRLCWRQFGHLHIHVEDGRGHPIRTLIGLVAECEAEENWIAEGNGPGCGLNRGEDGRTRATYARWREDATDEGCRCHQSMKHWLAKTRSHGAVRRWLSRY